MKSFWSDQIEAYDGRQLKSLFAYMKWGILGDSIVAWQGPCHVTLDHMVDGEDQRAQAQISGDLMLHFIVENFKPDLFSGVLMQRLLAAIVKDGLIETTPVSEGVQLKRAGDDIYYQDSKLSISIATVSPVSTLVHFAINIKNSGTPVKTEALGRWGIDPKIFASKVMEGFCHEINSVKDATQKVHWVK